MGINYFDNISLEDLAKKLIENPEQYNLQKRALCKGGHLGIVTPKIDLTASLEKLNKANLVARNGEVFIFDFESGFINRTEAEYGHAEIFRVYKLVGNEMLYMPDINDDYPDLNETSEKLKKKGISKLFTGEIPDKGYLGLENEWFDIDKDGYWQRAIDKHSIYDFKRNGIEVVNLGVLEE